MSGFKRLIEEKYNSYLVINLRTFADLGVCASAKFLICTHVTGSSPEYTFSRY